MKVRSTANKGIRVTQEHEGYNLTVSIQWGPGNYCDSQDHRAMYHDMCRTCRCYGELEPSSTVEVAAWRTTGRNDVWLPLAGEADDVLGWIPAERAFALLGWLGDNPAAISWDNDMLADEIRKRLKA